MSNLFAGNRLLTSGQPHWVTSGQSNSGHKQMYVSKLFSYTNLLSIQSAKPIWMKDEWLQMIKDQWQMTEWQKTSTKKQEREGEEKKRKNDTQKSRRHTNTTKTGAAYGNSHLACESVQGTSTLPEVRLLVLPTVPVWFGKGSGFDDNLHILHCNATHSISTAAYQGWW